MTKYVEGCGTDFAALSIVRPEDYHSTDCTDLVEAIATVLRRNMCEPPEVGELNRPALKKLLAAFLKLEENATEFAKNLTYEDLQE